MVTPSQKLDYARAGTTVPGRLTLARSMEVVAPMLAVPALCVVWTWAGLWYMDYKSYPSGSRWDTRFEPILIQRPVIFCTLTMLGLATIVVVEVVRRRLEKTWLGLLVLMAVIWFYYGMFMLYTAEHAFP